MMARKITDGLVTKMREMRERGLSTVRIAQLLGTSATTVSNYTRAAGFRSRTEADERIEHLEWCLQELTKVPENILVGLDLTRKPARILGALMAKPGQPVSRDQLSIAASFDTIAETTTPETVDAHICGIRKKIKEAGIAGRIETCWGVGYRWEPLQ